MQLPEFLWKLFFCIQFSWKWSLALIWRISANEETISFPSLDSDYIQYLWAFVKGTSGANMELLLFTRILLAPVTTSRIHSKSTSSMECAHSCIMFSRNAQLSAYFCLNSNMELLNFIVFWLTIMTGICIMMVEGNFLRSTLIKMLFLPVNRNPRWEAVNVEAYKGGNLP